MKHNSFHGALEIIFRTESLGSDVSSISGKEEIFDQCMKSMPIQCRDRCEYLLFSSVIPVNKPITAIKSLCWPLLYSTDYIIVQLCHVIRGRDIDTLLVEYYGTKLNYSSTKFWMDKNGWESVVLTTFHNKYVWVQVHSCISTCGHQISTNLATPCNFLQESARISLRNKIIITLRR